MKVSCDVIKDLIPLYLEGMASEDSNELVEKHVEECEECKQYLDEMQSFNSMPADRDPAPLLKIKKTLRMKKIQAVALAVLFTFIIGIIGIAFLTEPEYLPYSDEIVAVNEMDNGAVMVQFGSEVAGYDVNRYPAEDNTGYAYHLTTWENTWNNRVQPSELNNVILNPDGEHVVSVYYYQTDGSEDQLIYGEDLNPTGGTIMLPRGNLSYYLWFALILVVVFGIVLLSTRHNRNVFKFTMKLFFLPVSYLISHLIIKGLTFSSYNATRDFLAILLITIPLYAVFLLVVQLINSYKRN